MQQYLSLKAEHPDALLLFRLGDFYETFYEDAQIVSRALDLVLTGRDAGGGERAPMAGIPHQAVEGYLAKLLARGYRIALCEQMEDPKQARGLVRREVVRVLTPGTLTEAGLLDERRSNYLAAVAADDRSPLRWALAAVELSTGDFRLADGDGEGAAGRLAAELGRLAPTEVLLGPGSDALPGVQEALELLGAHRVVGRWDLFSPAAARARVEAQFPLHLAIDWAGTAASDRPSAAGEPLALCAAGAALGYLAETHRSRLAHLRPPVWLSDADHLLVDRTAQRHLELVANQWDGGIGGTLLEVLDATVTPQGTRLLREWILRPLTRRTAIEARLAAVADLVAQAVLRADVRRLLSGVRDIARITGRLAAGTASPRDLVALAGSLERLPAMAGALAARPPFAPWLAAFDPCSDVAFAIRQALVDEPPAGLVGVIRDGYSAEVDRLRCAASGARQALAELEARERERTGIKSLKVGYHRVFGYYIEVTRANLGSVPETYQRRQTVAAGERFVTPELKELEERVLGASDRLESLEAELFHGLCDQLSAQVPRLQATAEAVAAVDVLAALAETAARRGYARPEICDDVSIEIAAGRHPVLESLAPGRFVPNDTHLNERQHLLLLTGPNMGGKSTFMRQTALIALMAQMGSFVPADRARIGIVDRLFTRIGAADDLRSGRSTFMLEMTEVAHIMRQVTTRSLVLLDEIGRGTGTLDGLSIASAVLEALTSPNGPRPRTLLATHYHQLARLAESLEGVRNLTVAVEDRGGLVTFLHRVVPGTADRSYGIHVAGLAGLPGPLLDRARELLAIWAAEEETARQLASTSRRPLGWSSRGRRRPEDEARPRQLSLGDAAAGREGGA